RKNGQLEPASWEEALDLIAERLYGIKASAGAAAIGGIGSEVTTNEDSFVFQAFLRQAVGTPNVDHRVGTERQGCAALRPGPGAIAALPGRGARRGVRGARAVAEGRPARGRGEGHGRARGRYPEDGAGVRGREAGERHLRPAARGRAGRRRDGRGPGESVGACRTRRKGGV